MSPNPSNSDLVGEAVGDEFYGKHSWDRLINAPDYYEKPTPLELGLRDALRDAAQQLEQAEQRIRERDERIVHYIDAKRESEEMLHARAERYREALERIEQGEAGLTGRAVDIARAALTPVEGADHG